MKPLGKLMKDITLTEKESSSFNYLVPFDVEEDICEKCKKWFNKKFMMHLPGKEEPTFFERTYCAACELIEEEAALVRELMKENAKRKKDRLKRMFDENSLINPKLNSATFENYQTTNENLIKAKTITSRYAKNFSIENPVSLLLIGNYGTGKSHLSMAVTKELMEKDFTCIFISTPKLMTKIRSTYNKESEYTEDQIIDQLSKVDCLVLDDIGAESTKQGDGNQHTWATSKIFEIIDNRIGKHTIFTSNYEPKELQERLGGRNFSRMMESVHVIKMYGDDYRLKDFK